MPCKRSSIRDYKHHAAGIRLTTSACNKPSRDWFKHKERHTMGLLRITHVRNGIMQLHGCNKPDSKSNCVADYSKEKNVFLLLNLRSHDSILNMKLSDR